MDSRRIAIPDNLSIQGLADFSWQLRRIQEYDQYQFDFGRQRWFPPFSMLLLSRQLRHFVDRYPGAKFTVSNHRNHPYAAHMGFFRSFGLDFGNEPGEAAGSSTYVPLTDLQFDDLKAEAAARYEHIGDAIERRSNRLTELLLQQAEGDLFDTLSYSLREIVRNSVEHSGSGSVSICAQYWPKLEEVEVGIVDDGVGVAATLNENPSLSFTDDRDAIQLALLPGISGKAYRNSRSDRYNTWQNSGYGLYMTNRLCRHGGTFFINSNAAGVCLHNRGKYDVDLDLRGTAIRMTMYTTRIRRLREQLTRFSAEGTARARELGMEFIVNASTASRMLARDFRSNE
jgi:hypothetical protein